MLSTLIGLHRIRTFFTAFQLENLILKVQDRYLNAIEWGV